MIIVVLKKSNGEVLVIEDVVEVSIKHPTNWEVFKCPLDKVRR